MPPTGTPGPLVFLGSPVDAVPPLRALHGAGFDIDLVVTNPDRRRGRGSATSPTPVKAAAEELGLVVSHDVNDVHVHDAALGVVVAFGQIIRPAVLDACEMVNLHFSLLPRWRGAAPVERAVLAGDERTGVDLMDVAEGLDTGDIRARVEVGIGADETAQELRSRLVRAGTELLVDTLVAGLPAGRPQTGEPTYAHKLHAEDLHIDWSTTAVTVHRQVRVGGAWTTLDGTRLKIWRTSLVPTGRGVLAGTGDGEIELLEVQAAGKPRMDASSWANGAAWSPGEPLGT